MKKNLDVRSYAISKNVYFYEISDALGYSHECVFSRLLRNELSSQKKQKIFETIDKIANEKGSDAY